MLRENKRRFDIVISDVEMPDMDGIKLLQLVGLEMDIPVIMLSAYSDTKRVMQGVRNGACDYLVKPVRIQELQNIWQHVMRNSLQTATDAAGGSAPPTGKNNASKAAKHDNKGKAIKETAAADNNDDNDNDDDDEGGNDDDDLITPKKPRLFWSVELHQKFVDAVNLIGLDKAFPKKILDIMDVEGLTREKVASHLQKYRLYLRKVNNGTNQPGTGLGSLGVEDPHIASLGGGYGVYRSLAGPGRFPGVGSLLDQTAAMRLNTAAGLSLTGLSSSPMLQAPQLPTSNSTFSKFDSLSSPAFQNTNTSTMFQGIPPTTMQMNKTSACPPNTSMMLDGTTPPLNSRNFSNNSSSLISPSPNTGAFGFGSTTPNLLDPSSRPNWQAPTQPLLLTQNVIPSSGGMAPVIPQIQNEPLDIFCGINQHPHIWQNHVPNAGNNSSTPSSQINAVAPTPTENVGFNNMMGAPPFTPLEGASSQMMQQNEVQKSNDNSSLLKFDENFLLDDPKLLCGAGQTSEEYLEDIVGRFLQQGNGETSRAQDDPGLDPFLMQ